MSRRRPPARRWHIGDSCRVPWYSSWPPSDRGRVGGWHPAKVIAVRGDRVVVVEYGHETEHPWWELREPHVHRGLWQRWWSHDKRAGRLVVP